jgi:glutathione synthase/RimK-type ligase-like ATP-grasp enzyme
VILLWGTSGDGPLRRVRERLEELGAPVAMLDQEAGEDTTVDVEVGERVRGSVSWPLARLDLEAVRAVYLRPVEASRVGGGAHAEAVTGALWTWASLTSALVVNRPAAMASNASKPYQAGRIEAVGLRVPELLVTTDAARVRAFAARHGEVVYKSVSGVRSIVRRLGPEHGPQLERVASAPTQFQRRVGGVDVRVHVVGERVFATEIRSPADDYRYADDAPLELRPARLPAAITDRCRAVSADLGLTVAGIDLRHDRDGWWCFEVNPSPAFTFYDREPGRPIAAAVADLLAAA